MKICPTLFDSEVASLNTIFVWMSKASNFPFRFVPSLSKTFTSFPLSALNASNGRSMLEY